MFESPCLCPFKEDDVQLSVRATLCLRYLEACKDQRDGTRAGKEEACLRTPSPSSRIEHIWRDHVADNVEHVVGHAREHNGLAPQL